MKENKKDNKPEKGVTIPAGTEQETGLTRGKTEKKPEPAMPPPGNNKGEDDDSLIYKN